MDTYTLEQFDTCTWRVIKNGEQEFCVCSDPENELMAELRAEFICNVLNSNENGKYIVLDKSGDHGRITYGVNLNDESNDDFQGITVWDDVGDAEMEAHELHLNDVAGSWTTYRIVDVTEESYGETYRTDKSGNRIWTSREQEPLFQLLKQVTDKLNSDAKSDHEKDPSLHEVQVSPDTYTKNSFLASVLDECAIRVSRGWWELCGINVRCDDFEGWRVYL